MRKNYSLLLLLPLAIGCVRDVVLDAGEKPQVVVECVLTASSPQELRLSFTKGASLAEAPELTEATARLTDLTDDYPGGSSAAGRTGPGFSTMRQCPVTATGSKWKSRGTIWSGRSRRCQKDAKSIVPLMLLISLMIRSLCIKTWSEQNTITRH